MSKRADKHDINGCCMQSVRQLLATAQLSQSRLLAAVVARRRVHWTKNRSSAISASVSRGSLEMAAPWRKKCTFMRLRASAAKRNFKGCAAAPCKVSHARHTASPSHPPPPSRDAPNTPCERAAIGISTRRLNNQRCER
jgi:hypothetical protein